MEESQDRALLGEFPGCPFGLQEVEVYQFDHSLGRRGGHGPIIRSIFFSSVIEGLFVGNLAEGLHYLFIVPLSIFGLDARWLNPQLPLSSSEDSSSLLTSFGS